MTTCDLFPGEELQMLIDTYLPIDDQYYPDDLVLDNKTTFPSNTSHRALSNISESSQSTSSLQTEDLPSDILDFISSAATDTDVFTDYTESISHVNRQQVQQQYADTRYGSPMMYRNNSPLSSNVFEPVDNFSNCGSYPHHHHTNHHHHSNNSQYHRIDTSVQHRNFQLGRSPARSDCSSSDNESSIDGSPLSEFIPLPVQSYKEGAPLDLETFADVGTVTVSPRRGDTDEESTPCSPEPEQNNTRQRRKRPSRRRQKQLWEFILETLTNPTHNPESITWVDKETGIFKFVKSQQVARLWGQRRQREMSYEYFSRAMRHYYSRNIMKRVPGKRLVYQFLSGAEGWRQYAMKSPQ